MSLYIGSAKVTPTVRIMNAVIAELEVTPSTSDQTINVVDNITGYAPINVSAVTAAIDANIQPENIKEGVTILGVTGTYTGS